MVKFSSTTAIAIVIANMIGTGVFTRRGFQLLEVQAGSAIVLRWVIGGLAALCGALTYAELGSQLPDPVVSTTSWGAYIIRQWCLFLAGFLSTSDSPPHLRSPR